MPRIRHDLLSGVKLFTGLEEPDLSVLSAKTKRRRLTLGDRAFSQGDCDIPLQIVIEGCIRLERVITAHETARVATISEGEAVDELSFVSGLPTTANAVAIEDTEIVELSADDYGTMIKRHPSICPSVSRILARQLRDSRDKVESLLALDAAARLSREILRFVPMGEGPQSVEVALPFSQEELAHRIGTRRETVNRCLKEFRQDGVLLDIGRNRYRVDVPALYRTAGMVVVRSAGK